MKSEQKRGMQKDAMKISQNTYMLETTRQAYLWKGRECYSMVYAVLEPDGITLIDTGFPDRGMEILNEVRELGKRKIDIKQIFLTHSDLDHMGNAAWIRWTQLSIPTEKEISAKQNLFAVDHGNMTFTVSRRFDNLKISDSSRIRINGEPGIFQVRGLRHLLLFSEPCLSPIGVDPLLF